MLSFSTLATRRPGAVVFEARIQSLASLRLPGPLEAAESLLTLIPGLLPTVDGFGPPKRLRLDWGGDLPHPSAAYVSGEGTLLVVSHESGPVAIFPWIEGAAATAALLQAAYTIFRHVANLASPKARQIGYIECVLRELDVSSGTYREQIVRIPLKPRPTDVATQVPDQ